MAAYYNEFDPHAAQWLRNLIAEGLIAPGDVDERSIAEVTPHDLEDYTQCHFFAGISGWSLALRLAGWPDDRPVWTGSCPCQPFSAAGKGLGEKDERHLWPEFRRLIAECAPAAVFGEQVASKAGRLWLAGVRADLEALGYAVGGADLCAAGVGAPHIRQRLWWVADAAFGTKQRGESRTGERPVAGCDDARAPAAGGLADADGKGRSAGRLPVRSGRQDQAAVQQQGAFEWLADARDDGRQPSGHGSDLRGVSEAREETRSAGSAGAVSPERLRGRGGDSEPVRLEHTARDGREERRPESGGRRVAGGCGEGRLEHAGGTRGAAGLPAQASGGEGHAEVANDAGGRGYGAWDSAIWIPCADGKARRIEPGLEPLVDGVPGRVGRLRAYGNAIVPQEAAEFIVSADEALRLARQAANDNRPPAANDNRPTAEQDRHSTA